MALVPSPQRTLTEQDTIVLADFENTTGEPVFDGALKVALAVALEQSPFLKVFPDERARETLRLMNRPPDERVTRAIAREIAQREQLKALIAGSIARSAATTCSRSRPSTRRPATSWRASRSRPPARKQVLTSLGTAASQLREKLGESLASIEKFDVPLPRATTSSLDALHAYSLALDRRAAECRGSKRFHISKRAIELDPDFAMAHAQLSGVYTNTGQSALAPSFSRRAFELRDRVSERERFFISWRYYRDAAQAWDKALELARSWTTTYPREAFAFNSLGSALPAPRPVRTAVEPFREAIRLDPEIRPAVRKSRRDVHGARSASTRRRRCCSRRSTRSSSSPALTASSTCSPSCRAIPTTMATHLEASIGMRKTNAAFGWQARVPAFAGRMRDRARPVPPRRPDVASARLQGSGGAARR